MRPRVPGLVRDRRGVVAVEFALLTPFLMLLMLGMFEVVSLVRVNLKLSHTANELSTIVAAQQPPVSSTGQPQPTPLTQAQVSDFCKGVSYTLNPYASSSLSAAVVSLSSSAGGAASADWEADSGCGTKAVAFAPAAVSAAGPSGYNLTPTAGDRLVAVKVSYVYTPLLHYVLGSSWTLSQTAFARTRNTQGLTCAGCS